MPDEPRYYIVFVSTIDGSSLHPFAIGIKLQNILFTADKVLKLADFGLAFHSKVPDLDSKLELSHEVGTLWYRAPAILNKESYNYQADL